MAQHRRACFPRGALLTFLKWNGDEGHTVAWRRSATGAPIPCHESRCRNPYGWACCHGRLLVWTPQTWRLHLESGWTLSVTRSINRAKKKQKRLTHTLTTADVDFFVGGGRGRGGGGGGGGCSFCSCSSTTVLFGKGTQTTTDDQPHLQRHRETKNSRTVER